MNPVTFIEAFAEPHLLIGLALGAVAGGLAWWHRNGDAWAFTLGLAAIVTYVVNAPYDWSGVPPVAYIVAMIAVAAVASLGASMVASVYGAPEAGACFALTALGVWGTVPEIDMVLGLLGVGMGGAVGGLRARGDTLGPLAPTLFLLAAGFSAITEGIYRDSAPIGALAVMGVFLILPAVLRWMRPMPGWSIVGAHVALVIMCGRVAGTAETVWAALSIAVAAHVAMGAALVFASRVWPTSGPLAQRQRPTRPARL